MRVDFFKGAILAFFIGFTSVLHAADNDIDLLRSELAELSSVCPLKSSRPHRASENV